MSAKKSVAPETAAAPEAPQAAPEKTETGKAGRTEVKRVEVRHVTRVEGHGNIFIEIDPGGKMTACRWEVPEAPRFFEAMLLGRSFEDAHQISSRICGICAIGHQLASLQATEDALGVEVSEQTVILRKLGLHGENMQSHVLHFGYLVLPDLVGQPSVFPLLATHKKEVGEVVALHRLANDLSRLICGRTTHPQRMVPGGFLKIPTEEELREMRKRLKAALSGAAAVAELFASLKGAMPAFERPTEYVALVSSSREYPLLRGEIGSSKDVRRPARFYKDVAREYCVRQSTAKWSKNVEASYLVGALARFNLNHERLAPAAQKIAAVLGLAAPCHNPFYNNLAQVVETVHSIEDSIQLIDLLLDRGLRDEEPRVIKPRTGTGVGAVEVPRGILFHAYSYDERGRIVLADCVIPTNQNHANIQYDLESLIPGMAEKSEAEIELAASMLVRAYDPCISCSTHRLEENPKPGVVWVRRTS